MVVSPQNRKVENNISYCYKFRNILYGNEEIINCMNSIHEAHCRLNNINEITNSYPIPCQTFFDACLIKTHNINKIICIGIPRKFITTLLMLACKVYLKTICLSLHCTGKFWQMSFVYWLEQGYFQHGFHLCSLADGGFLYNQENVKLLRIACYFL